MQKVRSGYGMCSKFATDGDVVNDVTEDPAAQKSYVHQ